jgi:hypothetical protein
VVDFERHIQLYTFQAAYGLTDRLSLGVRIPYWTQDVRVKAALDNRTGVAPRDTRPRTAVCWGVWDKGSWALRGSYQRSCLGDGMIMPSLW